MSDEDDLLGGSGKFRSLSFKGSPVIEHRDLTILERVRKVQARDPQTGEAKFFKHKSGPQAGQPDTDAPIFQYVYKVQLPQGFPSDPDVVEEYGDDDGVRFLYIGGPAATSSKSSRSAMATALKRAGVKAAMPGGVINRFAFVGEGTATSRAFNPPKFYEAKYTPPVDGGTTELDDKAGSAPTEDDEPPF